MKESIPEEVTINRFIAQRFSRISKPLIKASVESITSPTFSACWAAIANYRSGAYLEAHSVATDLV